MEATHERDPRVNPPRSILYLISCYSSVNTGHGGHYYSLRETVRTLNDEWGDTQINVLAIGDVFPEALQDTTTDIHFINVKQHGILGALRRALALSKSLQPSHVHSFDDKAHFIGRVIAARRGAKSYYTKPGGPNPKSYYPFAPDIVFFSEENKTHYSESRKLSRSRLHLIPQRGSAPITDMSRTAELKELIEQRLVVMRICRIGLFYRRSAVQTVALARRLKNEGHDAVALIIGTVQDEETYRELREISGTDALILTDPHFTRNASELLSLATIVVGTGRSLIEAALADRIVLAMLNNSELPVLVTNQNWRKLGRRNFSERSELPRADQCSIDDIARAIHNDDRSGARAVAAAYNIRSAVPSYLALYSVAQPRHYKPLDLIQNFLIVLKPYLRTRLASVKASSS
ncbi:glycosyltransferase family 4 protein [Nesterenkonia populi]|uniref:glycosyltransferase family 4 protein n=1 Tax=Nesterenkonia populi TaxID=1591087 RepID=UPI0011BE8365|nr:glycosyltransferase family 4 protein [Nesterenkonia populi]